MTIKMMVDALLPFLDYRGWMFGVNDATEREVGGEVLNWPTMRSEIPGMRSLFVALLSGAI